MQESLHVLPSYIHEVLGPIEPPGRGCCDQHSLPKLWEMVPGPWHANGMAIELGEWSWGNAMGGTGALANIKAHADRDWWPGGNPSRCLMPGAGPST